MKVELKTYALVAEIASAIAVVASLVFVGFEVRQSAEETSLNTNAIQVSAYQDLIAGILNINELIATDEELAEIDLKADTDFESLSPIEERRYRAFWRLAIRLGDLAYYQYETGLLDEERLYSALGPVRGELRTEFGAALWSGGVANGNYTYSEAYIRYVENMMYERQPENPVWQPN